MMKGEVIGMFEKMAERLAAFYAARGVYAAEKIPVYKYGFELLLSTVANLLLVTLIAAVSGTLLGAVCFCAGFIPMRLVAGGYHAHHHWSCILSFALIYSLFVAFYDTLSADWRTAYALAAMLCTALAVMLLAPVAARNKPLTATERQRQRRRSLELVGADVFLALGGFLIPLPLVCHAALAFYASGVLAAGGLLVAAAVEARKQSQH